MRIAYVNTYINANHTGGGYVHMGQFVRNALALGHEIWSYPNSRFPGAHEIPIARFPHIKTLRQMDVQYVRIEKNTPGICTWTLPPRRLLYGFPVVVWEFNTIPDEALHKGEPDSQESKARQILTRYGRGCDLAVCVSSALAEVVKQKLGLQRVLVVPNGSDPELFRPDIPIAKRMFPFQGKLNVVWIGSAEEAWHDLKMLGEAAQLIWEADSDRRINFHILGPNLAGKMAEMPPNVYCWGAEYYEKLPVWLAGMDVGLNLYHPGPADYNSPLKVFDYMASGLTVVSTVHPFMNDLFGQLGQSDLMVPSGDSKFLADRLVNLASDRERVRRLGQAGRELVIKHYNWHRAVQDTMTKIETILREKKKKRHENP
jgi:glycosyltransferase involved in cell wall biosynthesis